MRVAKRNEVVSGVEIGLRRYEECYSSSHKSKSKKTHMDISGCNICHHHCVMGLSLPTPGLYLSC